MRPLISIIIPVYNTPKEYVRQCLDAIIKQSYVNWECVFVDNGSDEDYSEFLADDRIKYTRIENNQGVFLAYKHGFSVSNGEYVVYCDSDDWLSEGYLQKVIDNLESEIDTYLMNIISVFDNGYREKAIWPNKGLQDYQGREWFEALCNRTKSAWVLWGVTLSRDILQKTYNSIKIQKNIIGPHDLFLTIIYSFFSKGVKFIPFNGFFYRITNNSASRSSVTKEKLKKIIEDHELVFNYLNTVLKNENINSNILQKIKTECGKNFVEVFYQYKNYEELFSQFSDKTLKIYGIELVPPKKTIKEILLPENTILYKFMRFLMMKIYRIIKP